MKLRNKLIPLITVAATATTIAPLATSCGNIVLETTELTDVMHGYMPDIEKAKASDTLTEAQAKDLYVEHITKNPDIFAQDLYWWESIALKYRLMAACYTDTFMSTTPTFVSDLATLYGLSPATEDPRQSFDIIPQVANFGVSNISLGKVKLVNPNTREEETIDTISLKMEYEYQYELNGDCVNDVTRFKVQRVTTQKLTSEYKNIPFTVIWDTEYATWRVMPLGWWKVPGHDTTWILTKLQNWAFNFDLKSITTDTIQNYCGGTDTYTYDESTGGNIDTVAKLIDWVPQNQGTDVAEAAVRGIAFNFGSYFLYNIMGPEWSTGNLGYRRLADKEDDDLVRMNYAMNLNWTYQERASGIYPKYRDSWFSESVKWYMLNDDTKSYVDPNDPERLVFDAYYTDPTTKVKSKVGTATFKKDDNNDLLYNENPSNPTSAAYSENDCAAQICLKVRFTFDPELTEMTELPDDWKENLSFTIPQGKKFIFNIYYGLDSEGEQIFKEHTVVVQNDVNCFWFATDYTQE